MSDGTLGYIICCIYKNILCTYVVGAYICMYVCTNVHMNLSERMKSSTEGRYICSMYTTIEKEGGWIPDRVGYGIYILILTDSLTHLLLRIRTNGIGLSSTNALHTLMAINMAFA